MTVSIIIAVKTWQKNLEECVNKCLELNYPDFEIIILPDAPVKRSFKDSRIKIIPTGEVSPPLKRDIGIENASGEILAFLDDDAYPVKDWLVYAAESFSDPAIAAVGGPGVTPHEDSITQKASGLIYSSFLMSGTYGYRYIPFKRTIEVDDFPSCNLLVRKSVVKEAGGFKSNYWPGEDTVLC
ncbi:MAG: glycosyltransferase, partial [Candidatus Omnitrophica bacterium]|nr:glycosyltransferase [Candidatus Omnitrophota bacterium]